MDDRAEGQKRGNARAISKLDWPTPEMLAAAHRARGIVLRQMVVALARRLKTLVAEQLLFAKPAKVPITTKRWRRS
jgi:hypothetical protein